MKQAKKLDEMAIKKKELEEAKQNRESEEENVLKLEESATKRMIKKGKIHAMVQREIENAIIQEGDKAEKVHAEVDNE